MAVRAACLLLHGLYSSFGEQGLLSSCSVQASHCGGFSCCRAQALGHSGFCSCGTWAIECRLNSCGAWAQLFHSMRDYPGLGIKPMSLALAGGFFATEQPGKL